MNKLNISKKLLNEISNDPLMIEKLSNRVYELWRQETLKQKERNHGYRSK